MNKDIEITLSSRSINRAIRELEKYKANLLKKTEKLVKRLQEEGFVVAEAIAYNVSPSYDLGELDIRITKEKPTKNGNRFTAVIRGDGEDILFIEFGTGIRYSGYAHPKKDEFGMGAGTYPEGKGHWNDPKGWYFKDESGKHHTYGNPALMPMYNAEMQIILSFEKIAREVFSK